MPTDIAYTPAGTSGHAVTFYADDAELMAAIRRQVIAGAARGAAAIFIVTEPHRRALEHELAAVGIDPDAAVRDGKLWLLDAAGTMAQFVSGGVVDRGDFRRVVGGVVERAAQTGRPVVAFGEMVSLLWDAGHVQTALELEQLWNELADKFQFFLLCGYKQTSVAADVHAEALCEVCRLHTAAESVPSAGAQRQAGREFTGDPAGPAAARRFIADVLAGWGHDGGVVDDAKLVVSELSTNAVVHAGSAFRLEARLTSAGIRISIHDASPVAPGTREGHIRMDSGHGLNLVAALSERWGVDRSGAGKIVWAELLV